MSTDTIDLPEIRPVSGPQETSEKTGDGTDQRKGWKVIAALVLLLVSALAVDQIIRSGYFTIERVMISNRVQHVDQGIVERTAWRSIHGNYLNVDLSQVEKALETLPGIYQAMVRRVWPDALELQVVETQAMARFQTLQNPNESAPDSYINLAPGQALRASPVLRGPKEQRETLVDTFFSVMPLLQEAGLEPLELFVSKAGRWTLEVRAEGSLVPARFELLLGRDGVVEKVDRFTRSFTIALGDKADRIDKVDMRYASGFAVQWEQENTETVVQLAGLSGS